MLPSPMLLQLVRSDGGEAIWDNDHFIVTVNYWTLDEWERLPEQDRPKEPQRLGPIVAVLKLERR